VAEILGLTVSHFPYLRLKHYCLPNVLIGNLARGWVDKPHLKDPSNWPPQMREEWSDDRGAAVGKAAQAHQIEQFRKLRGALDDFRPDFMVFLYRDIAEAFKNFAKPPYWIHAHDQLDVKLFQIHGNRENYWEEDPDRVDTIYGHPEAAAYLTRKLQDAGLNPLCCPESMAPLGLGHNALAGVVHLDWDRHEFKTPFIPIGVDPFGFFRTRNNEGLSPWNRDLPRPLLPKEAFNLGREIVRAFRPSPWRVALVGVTAWSHANDSGWEYERLHQDIDADRRRFEQWRNNQFDQWGDNWNFEEMEEHAQWELLISIILAGAMTELGAKVQYADMTAHWILNSTWVTTIFDAK
jgi:hypothetical protein